MTGHFLRVAEAVLATRVPPEPMTPEEIVDTAQAEGMLDTAGRTPHQTMKARMSVEIRRNGPHSTFVRTEPGRYFLRRFIASPDEVYEARPKRPTAPREEVLVFDTGRLDRIGRFQGIRRDADSILAACIDAEPTYLERLVAEQDNDHKQIVTYVLVARGNRLLYFERGTYNHTAAFLRGVGCVGFGGHVTYEDRSLLSHNGISGNAARELGEELKLPAVDRDRLLTHGGLQLLGVLNDDSTDVGRRHLAVIYRYDVSVDPGWEEPQRGELGITQLRWINFERDDVRVEKFEYWSQLCLREFYADLIRPRPAYRVRRHRPVRPPHVLCVLGQIGSGKTQATSVLRSDFAYVEVNSGAALARLLGRNPITAANEDEREEFQRDAMIFIRAAEGPQSLAAAIWDDVERQNSDRVVIDGVRQRETLDWLAVCAGEAVRRPLGRLYIHTPADVAFEFYRRRRGADTTVFDFIRVRDAPVEGDVAQLITDADAVIYNAAGLRSFRAMIRRYMRELGVPRRESGGHQRT